MEQVTLNDFFTQIEDLMKMNPGFAKSVDAVIGGMDTLDAASRFMTLSQKEIDDFKKLPENIECNITDEFIESVKDGLMESISEYEKYDTDLIDSLFDLKSEQPVLDEVFPESKIDVVDEEKSEQPVLDEVFPESKVHTD